MSILIKSFASTGEWQNWNTVSSLVQLSAGKHKLWIIALNPGFNINKLEKTRENPKSISGSQTSDKSFEIFPNPSTGYIQIRSEFSLKTIQELDVMGKIIHAVPFSTSVNIDKFPPGLYYMKVFDEYNRLIGIQ